MNYVETVPLEPSQRVMVRMLLACQTQARHPVPAGCLQLAAGAHVGHEAIRKGSVVSRIEENRS